MKKVKTTKIGRVAALLLAFVLAAGILLPCAVYAGEEVTPPPVINTDGKDLVQEEQAAGPSSQKSESTQGGGPKEFYTVTFSAQDPPGTLLNGAESDIQVQIEKGAFIEPAQIPQVSCAQPEDVCIGWQVSAEGDVYTEQELTAYTLAENTTFFAVVTQKEEEEPPIICAAPFLPSGAISVSPGTDGSQMKNYSSFNEALVDLRDNGDAQTGYVLTCYDLETGIYEIPAAQTAKDTEQTFETASLAGLAGKIQSLVISGSGSNPQNSGERAPADAVAINFEGDVYLGCPTTFTNFFYRRSSTIYGMGNPLVMGRGIESIGEASFNIFGGMDDATELVGDTSVEIYSGRYGDTIAGGNRGGGTQTGSSFLGLYGGNFTAQNPYYYAGVAPRVSEPSHITGDVTLLVKPLPDLNLNISPAGSSALYGLGLHNGSKEKYVAGKAAMIIDTTLAGRKFNWDICIAADHSPPGYFPGGTQFTINAPGSTINCISGLLGSDEGIEYVSGVSETITNEINIYDVGNIANLYGKSFGEASNSPQYGRSVINFYGRATVTNIRGYGSLNFKDGAEVSVENLKYSGRPDTSPESPSGILNFSGASTLSITAMGSMAGVIRSEGQGNKLNVFSDGATSPGLTLTGTDAGIGSGVLALGVTENITATSSVLALIDHTTAQNALLYPPAQFSAIEGRYMVARDNPQYTQLKLKEGTGGIARLYGGKGTMIGDFNSLGNICNTIRSRKTGEIYKIVLLRDYTAKPADVNAISKLEKNHTAGIIFTGTDEDTGMVLGTGAAARGQSGIDGGLGTTGKAPANSYKVDFSDYIIKSGVSLTIRNIKLAGAATLCGMGNDITMGPGVSMLANARWSLYTGDIDSSLKAQCATVTVYSGRYADILGANAPVTIGGGSGTFTTRIYGGDINGRICAAAGNNSVLTGSSATIIDVNRDYPFTFEGRYISGGNGDKAANTGTASLQFKVDNGDELTVNGSIVGGPARKGSTVTINAPRLVCEGIISGDLAAQGSYGADTTKKTVVDITAIKSARSVFGTASNTAGSSDNPGDFIINITDSMEAKTQIAYFTQLNISNAAYVTAGMLCATGKLSEFSKSVVNINENAYLFLGENTSSIINLASDGTGALAVTKTVDGAMVPVNIYGKYTGAGRLTLGVHRGAARVKDILLRFTHPVDTGRANNAHYNKGEGIGAFDIGDNSTWNEPGYGPGFAGCIYLKRSLYPVYMETDTGINVTYPTLHAALQDMDTGGRYTGAPGYRLSVTSPDYIITARDMQALKGFTGDTHSISLSSLPLNDFARINKYAELHCLTFGEGVALELPPNAPNMLQEGNGGRYNATNTGFVLDDVKIDNTQKQPVINTNGCNLVMGGIDSDTIDCELAFEEGNLFIINGGGSKVTVYDADYERITGFKRLTIGETITITNGPYEAENNGIYSPEGDLVLNTGAMLMLTNPGAKFEVNNVYAGLYTALSIPKKGDVINDTNPLYVNGKFIFSESPLILDINGAAPARDDVLVVYNPQYPVDMQYLMESFGILLSGKTLEDYTEMHCIRLTEIAPARSVIFGFTKVDAKTNEPLEGALFTLYNCQNEDEGHEHTPLVTEEILQAGTCWQQVTVEGEEGPEPLNATSMQDGSVTFFSIGMGEYMLVEKQAPKGYETPSGQWLLLVDAETNNPEERFTITARHSEALGVKMPPAFIKIVEEYEGNTIVTYQLPNMKQFALPLSGGWGALTFVATGAVLMAGATGAALYKKKKR